MSASGPLGDIATRQPDTRAPKRALRRDTCDDDREDCAYDSAAQARATIRPCPLWTGQQTQL